MPMYEFACASCSHTFESLIRDEAELRETHCPACQSDRVERLLSVPAAPPSSGGMSDLPMQCNSQGPPCGAPWCRRPQ